MNYHGDSHSIMHLVQGSPDMQARQLQLKTHILAELAVFHPLHMREWGYVCIACLLSTHQI